MMGSVDGLGLDKIALDRCGACNFDPARLERFGHFALQIDVQHPVLVARAFHMDVVGKVVDTARDEDVRVRFSEVDGEDGVWIGREIDGGD